MNPLSTAFGAAADFLHQPFKQPMDTFHLFLLVGVVMIAALLWTRILSYLPREA